VLSGFSGLPLTATLPQREHWVLTQHHLIGWRLKVGTATRTGKNDSAYPVAQLVPFIGFTFEATVRAAPVDSPVKPVVEAGTETCPLERASLILS